MPAEIFRYWLRRASACVRLKRPTVTESGCKLSMNRKYSAKYRARVAGIALAGCLMPLSVTADVDDLAQTLRSQQQKSRFQLMLEQVQASARQRAAVVRTTPAAQAHSPKPTMLGDWTQSVRLNPVTVTEPVPRLIVPASTARLRNRQAYERDQQRILEYRQQRRALIAAPRAGVPVAFDGYAHKRRELMRYRRQDQQQSLQRKLRR